MNTIQLPTTLHCGGCVASIKPFFDASPKIKEWKVDLTKPVKTITATGEGLQNHDVIALLQEAGYDVVGAPLAGALGSTALDSAALDSAVLDSIAQNFNTTNSNTQTSNALPPIGDLNSNTQMLNGQSAFASNRAPVKDAPTQFWNDNKIWGRASFNTLNCLVGCSIGDFGTVIFLQAFYPHTTMPVQMLLATISGLCTSVMLESVILKVREGFAWKNAFQTAFSMSFISMVTMELAMNASDFMVTGGKAAFNTSAYWLAFAIASVAGFLVPLPYNYFKLKKYNKSCH